MHDAVVVSTMIIVVNGAAVVFIIIIVVNIAVGVVVLADCIDLHSQVT